MTATTNPYATNWYMHTMPVIQPQYGWVCPKCNKVHAPWVAGCNCHELNYGTITTTMPCSSTVKDNSFNNAL